MIRVLSVGYGGQDGTNAAALLPEDVPSDGVHMGGHLGTIRVQGVGGMKFAHDSHIHLSGGRNMATWFYAHGPFTRPPYVIRRWLAYRIRLAV